MPVRFVIPALLLILAGGPLAAQDLVRLSEADREAAIEAGADRLPINGAPGMGDGRAHGEVGVLVGSNGSHAIYGDTIMPLSNDAALGISVLDARNGGWHPR